MDFCCTLDDMLGYPQDPEHDGEMSKYVIEQPFMNIETARYEDNGVVIDGIWRRMRELLEFLRWIIITGDEQTFDRMLKLVIYGGDMFKHCIPWPGEMHLTSHHCAVVYLTWWDPLLKIFPHYLGRERVTKVFTVTHWNHHDQFLLVFVEAVRRYFREVLAHDWMEQRAGIAAAVRNNHSLNLLFQFMLQDGIPYVALRNLLRMSPSPERRAHIDKFYPYLCARFRAHNKFHYSCLTVHAMFIKNYLQDDIVAVIDAMYCQSCKGHPGRNTALDGLMEKINKLAKQMVHGIATEERVAAVVPWINVIEPVESGWQKLYPNYAEDGRAYIGAPNYDVDIAMLVEWFREHIGRDFASATAFSNYDVFRGRSGIGLVSPWEHIERAYTDDIAYAHAKCAECVFR